MSAVVTGHGHALPAPMGQQALWEGYFREHYADARVARAVWAHSGITTRHGVVSPLVEDVSGWGTAARMERFVQEAVPLGGEAVGKALAAAGLDPADVGGFVVASTPSSSARRCSKGVAQRSRSSSASRSKKTIDAGIC